MTVVNFKIKPCLNLHKYKHMSLIMRKPAFCLCENKDADQLRGNREADQRLCFRYTDSTIPLLPKSEISSLYPSSVAIQPGLCRPCSETPKTGFLRTRLIFLKATSKHSGNGLICPRIYSRVVKPKALFSISKVYTSSKSDNLTPLYAIRRS